MNQTELGWWAQEKIAAARSEAPHLLTEDGRALMVWGTIGSCGYVTAQGEVYLEDDFGNASPPVTEPTPDATTAACEFP